MLTPTNVFRMFAVRAMACAIFALALLGHGVAAFACSNAATPGFRSYLVHCGAYETVTPSYKGGYAVQNPLIVSELGPGSTPLIWGVSFGAFAGATTPVAGARDNDYLFEREAGGWHPTAIDPPESEWIANGYPGNAQGQLLAMAPAGTSLFMLHRPTESVYGSDFYRRETSGAYTRVGSALPSGAVPPGPSGDYSLYNHVHYAGASASLDRLFFYIEPEVGGLPGASSGDLLWPGDTTRADVNRAQSLYEYEDGASEPHLVAVENGSLLGQCGVSLGRAHTIEPPDSVANVRHAVSEDGRVVYFTVAPACAQGTEPAGYGPEAYELYARVEGHVESVSAPSEGECEGECAGEPLADANFEGAASNGSVAFFTSTQKLVPNAYEDNGSHQNPEIEEEELLPDSAVIDGGCADATAGGGCNLYAYEPHAKAGCHLGLASAGSPSGADVQGVAAIAEDGSRVYFVARGVLTGPNAEERSPRAGQDNLYVSAVTGETQQGCPIWGTRYVATLSGSAPQEAQQWSIENPMDVTPDGRVLVFESEAALTKEAKPGGMHVYRYAAYPSATEIEGQPHLTDISAGAAQATIPHLKRPEGEGPAMDQHPAVSSDGERVVFSAGSPLLAGIEPNERAGYVYEWVAGHVSLVSSPAGVVGLPAAVAISPAGTDVFLETENELVPQDHDSLTDVYDARVEGGFAEAPIIPSCVTMVACGGEVTAAPQLPVLTTTTQMAGGNASPKQDGTSKPSRASLLAKALRACDSRRIRRLRRRCRASALRRYAIRPARSGRPARSRAAGSAPARRGK